MFCFGLKEGRKWGGEGGGGLLAACLACLTALPWAEGFWLDIRMPTAKRVASSRQVGKKNANDFFILKKLT